MPKSQSIYFKFCLTGLTLSILSLGQSVLAQESKKAAPWVGKTLQGEPCRGYKIPTGPYDYLDRDQHKSALQSTEQFHLTPRILKLQQDTSTSAINEIQYSLLTWPNHPKALYAAYQYRLKHRGQWRQRATSATPVECHLQRATAFSPTDPVPHMIYGLLLHNFADYPGALIEFRKANELLPNDMITLYNMGLTLVELEQFEEARQVAEEVYSTDFPLEGLKNKLIRAEQWNDPKANAVPTPTNGIAPSTAKLYTNQEDSE